MGLYVKNAWYHYRKQIEGKVYYQALKIRKGQEKLLSARLKQVENEITARHFGLAYEKNKTIKLLDFIKRYLEIKKDKKSWARDSQRLELIGKVWGDIELDDVSRSQIEKLEEYLIEIRKVKPSTINRYFEILRHFFNLAIEEGYLKENPLKGYHFFVEDGQRRALSKDEISRILESAKKIQAGAKSSTGSIIYDLILFALNTGMRLSEILFLKDSYIVEDMIYYPASKTKSRRREVSHKQRFKIILLNPQARSIVERYKGNGDYVFPMKWRNPNAVCRVVNDLKKQTGVSDFTFHTLRHTASTIISSQASLAAAKTVLGHADIKTTLQYTHPGLDEQRRTVRKLGKYFEYLRPK